MQDGVGVPQQPQGDDFDRAVVRRRRPAAAAPQGDEFDQAPVHRPEAVSDTTPIDLNTPWPGAPLPTAKPPAPQPNLGDFLARKGPTTAASVFGRAPVEEGATKALEAAVEQYPTPLPTIRQARTRAHDTGRPFRLGSPTGEATVRPETEVDRRRAVARARQAQLEGLTEEEAAHRREIGEEVQADPLGIPRIFGEEVLRQTKKGVGDLGQYLRRMSIASQPSDPYARRPEGSPVLTDEQRAKLLEPLNRDIEEREAETAGAGPVMRLARTQVPFFAALAPLEPLLPAVEAAAPAARLGERALKGALRIGRTGAVVGGASGLTEAARGGTPAQVGAAAAGGFGAGVGFGVTGEALGLARAGWDAAVQRAKEAMAGEDVARWVGPADPLARAATGDPYATLGLDRATATAEMATAARNRLAQRFHPDVAPDNPHAGATMSAVNAAHQLVVEDLARRAPPAAAEAPPAAAAAPEPPRPAPTPAEPGAQAPPAAPAAPVAPPTRAQAIEQEIQAALLLRDHAAVGNDPAGVATAQAQINALAHERALLGLAGQGVRMPEPAPAERPGRALHDVEGRPIPGSEIRPPLKAGEIDRPPQDEFDQAEIHRPKGFAKASEAIAAMEQAGIEITPEQKQAITSVIGVAEPEAPYGAPAHPTLVPSEAVSVHPRGWVPLDHPPAPGSAEELTRAVRPSRHVVGEDEARYGERPDADAGRGGPLREPAAGEGPVPAGRGEGAVPEPGAGAGRPPKEDQAELPLTGEERVKRASGPGAPPLTPEQGDLLRKPPTAGSADAIDISKLALPLPAEEKGGIRSGLRALVRAITLGVNPEWGGPAARATADTFRARKAEMFRSWSILKTNMERVDRVVAALPRRQQLAAWAAFEAGKPTGIKALDAPEGLPTLRRISDAATAGLVARDELKAEALIENWVGRYWQVDPEAARGLEGILQGRRPLAGPRTYRKQRTWPRLIDGLQAINDAQARLASGAPDEGDARLSGFKPLTYNVVRSLMSKIEEMLRATAAHDIIVDEMTAQRAQWVGVNDDPPLDANGEPWGKVDPEGRDPSFTKYGPRSLGKQGEVYVPGRITLGHLYAPKQSLAIWRGALSKGIRGDPIFGPFYEAYMALGNMTTQILLGFSGFHAGTISREAVNASLELSMSAALDKRAGAIPEHLAHAVGAPAFDFMMGRRILQQYQNPGVHPELEPVLKAMMAGGYRGTAENEWYTGERLQKLKDAFHEAVEKENPGGRRLWNGIKVGPDLLFAGVELQVMPLMRYYVPNLKAAAAYRAVVDEMAKLPPGYDRALFRARMAKVIKEMDYRYGQVNYDSYFMPKLVKDLAHAFFLAPGWTAGGATLLAKGVGQVPYRLARRLFGKDKKLDEEVVGRTARYVLASVVFFMVVNGILTYLHTGEQPEGKDFWFPRDGTSDPDGNANRYAIPGYEARDWYDWGIAPARDVAQGKPFKAVSRITRTLMNKSKPILGDFFRLAENRDYFGNMYYDPDHPTVGQVAKAVGGELASPITLRNVQEQMRRAKSGQATIGGVARSFIGVAPVKKDIQRTEAQNLMAEYLGRRGRTTLTPEQRERSRARADTVAMLRRGEDVEASSALERRAARSRLESGFLILPLDQKEAVYAAGEPWEKEVWLPLLEDARAREEGGRAPRRRAVRRRR